MVLLVNPLAEELLYLGFVATALCPRSKVLAASVSVVVRLSVHLYQGPLALVSIPPSGYLFGSYYLDQRRIWPVVIAHGLLDLVAMWNLVDWAA